MNPEESMASPAGRTLLDRPLPEDYRGEWSTLLARPIAPQPKHSGSLLLFQSGHRPLALVMSALAGVVPLPKISRIPHRRDTALLGLAAVYGDIIPCCSIAHLLDSDPSLDENAKMLLLEERPGRLWAAPVRSVAGLCRRPDDMHPSYSGLPEGWSLGCFTHDGISYDLLNPETLFRQINLATA